MQMQPHSSFINYGQQLKATSQVLKVETPKESKGELPSTCLIEDFHLFARENSFSKFPGMQVMENLFISS